LRTGLFRARALLTLDSNFLTGYRSVEMAQPDQDRSKILWMECLAGSAILVIVAIVLFMVFSYKPF
jgi:uncharacterized membrane protein YgaE (UPF0421/DUF939 family)